MHTAARQFLDFSLNPAPPCEAFPFGELTQVGSQRAESVISSIIDLEQPPEQGRNCCLDNPLFQSQFQLPEVPLLDFSVMSAPSTSRLTYGGSSSASSSSTGARIWNGSKGKPMVEYFTYGYAEAGKEDAKLLSKGQEQHSGCYFAFTMQGLEHRHPIRTLCETVAGAMEMRQQLAELGLAGPETSTLQELRIV